MALKNQPEFEQPETTVQSGPSPEAKAAADVAATKAIAKASSGAVTTPAQRFAPALAGYKDQFDAYTVSALSLAIPRITAEQGNLVRAKDEKLGEKIRLQVVSWNDRISIGIGVDNAESKEHFRVSYDGVHIDGEDTLVTDYIASLKAQGFDKAKSSVYIDLIGFLVWSEKRGDVPEEDRELHLVQLSPTSRGNFTAYAVSRGLLESKGIVQGTDLVEITAESKKNGSNSYTNMSFKAVK